MNANKKKNLLVLTVSFIVAVIVWCMVQLYYKPVMPVAWNRKVYQVANGWGYDIYKKGELYIQQTFIPVKTGREPFASEKQAARAADMVVEKLKKGQLPVLSKDEITLILSFAE
ncbi:DUF4907 domain-containing protein [Terrimonas rubra]|uniref:DUF4907 domain-containing protein n=1 Tax=Terrimonas rubra TaxID=1035890 RepID=A0ABW6A064_9BACT